MRTVLRRCKHQNHSRAPVAKLRHAESPLSRSALRVQQSGTSLISDIRPGYERLRVPLPGSPVRSRVAR